jgi:hypothetical protein
MDLNYKIDKNAIILSMGWLLILIIPSFLMVLKITSSFSSGLVIVVIFIMTIIFICYGRLLFAIKMQKIFIYFICFLCFCFLQFLINTIERDLLFDDNKFFISIVGVVIVFFSSVSICYYLLDVSNSVFNKACKIIGVVLIFNAIISLFGFDVFHSGLSKPNFFFQEPSHFVLVAYSFIIYFSILLKSKWRILLLIFVIFWALYVQNATMLSVVLISIFISFRLNFLSIITLLLIFICGGCFLDFSNLSYFSDRLALSSDSNNLSVLVLVQGWENAIDTLTHISIFGVGLQQFGIVTILGTASYKIQSLIGFNLNLYDGGSLAPKIIGEFGVIGVFIVVIYIKYLIGIFLNLKRMQRVDIYYDNKILFAYSVILGSFIDFFIRGTGYFSPSIYMFIISMIYLNFIKKVRS